MQTPRSTRAIPAAEWAVASSHGFATTRMDFGGHHRYPSSPSTARRHAPMAARLGSPSSPRSHHNVQLVPLGATQQYARSNPVVSGPAASKQARVSYDIFGTRSVAPPAPFERAISTPGRQAIRHNNLVSHPNGYVDSALFSPSATFTTQVGRPVFGSENPSFNSVAAAAPANTDGSGLRSFALSSRSFQSGPAW